MIATMPRPVPTPTYVMGVPWDQSRVRSMRAMQAADSAPDGLTFVMDTEHDAWQTWMSMIRLASAEHPTDGTLFLEDDVVLAEDWRTRVEHAIAQHPDRVIQFFSLSDRYPDGMTERPASTFSMNQCYYLPAGYARNLWEYAQAWHGKHPEHPTGYDLAMRAWLVGWRERYLLHTPSLVQHRDSPSVISGSRSSKRQSPTFERDA